MKTKLTAVALCMFLCMSGLLHAQTLDSLLAQYDRKVPQEKVYVHFDNTQYAPGETVWYKAYLVKDLSPSELSKNLYLDWFDEYGKLVKRIIAPVINATASGDFTIPQTYNGSRLQVIAYTKWMLNFDSSFLFHQTLRVAQAASFFKDLTGSVPGVSMTNLRPVIPVTTLQFFPEGGDFVTGISCGVAFKALNSAGLPIAVSGTILNKNKQVVASFSSEHDGMGKLSLTPLPGEIYTAEWKDPQENTRFTNLPQAKSSGLVLTIKNESGPRQFTVERPVVLEDRFKRITIIGTINQQLVFRATANLADKNKIAANLPASDFPSGILQLTIFDNNMQPAAERLVFVNNEDYNAAAEVHIDTLNLEKRGKNVFQVELNDSVQTSLSLSITEGEGMYDSSQNIISQLLLSSDIKGHVHNPAYYFSPDADSAARHIDLVMLTNGWRRFVWDDVLSAQTPQLKYTYDSGYLSIKGKIDNLSDKKIKKAELMNLVLVAKDSSKQFIFTPLQPDGSFREDNLVLFDTTKIFFQLNNVYIPGSSHVSITNTFMQFDSTTRGSALPIFLPDTTGMARIKAIADEQKKSDSLAKTTTLKEVIVTTKVKTRIQEIDEKYAQGLFSGNGNAKSFNIVDDPVANSFSSALHYLQSRVAGLQINNATSFNPSATWRGSGVSFYVNEMKVDAATLAATSMADIAYIKVFPPIFMGTGGGGGGGAIAVYTMKGGDYNKNISPGLNFILLPGYTPMKEFYSPNYAEKQISFSQPDRRRTLYWQPNIFTDATNKKIRISFYNNDLGHSLRLVLEGMSADGRLIHITKFLK
ncbi:MAG: hypothetical protein ABI581_06895 [Sediminibacterium sp.]